MHHLLQSVEGQQCRGEIRVSFFHYSELLTGFSLSLSSSRDASTLLKFQTVTEVLPSQQGFGVGNLRKIK